VSGEAKIDPGHLELFQRSDRFELLRPLGRGGMGVVYEATDRRRKSKVALKILVNFGPRQLYLFKQEFRSLSHILHPNLVTLHELLCEEGSWFFTMELVDGAGFIDYVRSSADESLASTTCVDATEAETQLVGDLVVDTGDDALLAPQAGPTLDELEKGAETRLRRALLGLADGVMALHAEGKLHRDLKPSNVRVRPDGQVVILDFGLVADLEVQRDGKPLGIVSGTVPYMSPEQGAGEPLTAASDWYAFGVMLYELLTGRLPFAGTISEVLRIKKARPPVPVLRLAPKVPRDLARLCDELLQCDPTVRPDGDEVLRRLGRTVEETAEVSATLASRGSGALVGRERLLEELHEAFADVRGGLNRVVHVYGRSGMGKTALIQAFLDEVLDAGSAVVLAGRCYERESVPYKALDPVVDSLARVLVGFPSARVASLLPAHIRALAQVFPVLDQVKTVATAVRSVERALEPREVRRRAFAGLREMLTRLARQVPLILHIDDAQWGDMDSAFLLGELLRPPEPPPLLLIFSYRSENLEGSQVLSKLRGSSSADYRRLEVGPLTEGDARRLALRHLPDDPERSALAAHIARESAGIPFYIEELARHVAVLRDSAGEMAPGTLPSIDEFTRHRVKRLEGTARKLLEAVAVAGRPVPLAIAAQGAGLDEDSFGPMHSLRAAHLAHSHGSQEDSLVECSHDRIREAVWDGLDGPKRATLHFRLAVALERWGQADAEVLARHFREAGEGLQAARYARKAADQAARALAFDRAAGLYRMCLEAGQWERADAVAIQIALAEVLAAGGRGREASDAFLKVAETAATEDGWRYRVRAADQLLESGHIDRGRELFREVLAHVGISMPDSDFSVLAQFLQLRARVKLRGYDFESTPAAQVSRALLERIDICWSVALGLALVEPVRAAIFQVRALLLSLKSGEPYRIARSLAVEAGYAAAFGGEGYRRANELMEQAEALARTVENPHAIAIVRTCSAISAFQQGEWRRTLERAREAEHICLHKLTGASWALHTARVYQLAALGWMGHFAEARKLIHDLVTDAFSRNDLHTANHTRAGSMLHFELMQDNPDGARKDISECASDLSQRGFTLLHMYALRSRICIELYLGNGAEALRLADELQRRFRKATIKRIALMGTYNLEMQTNAALCAAPETVPAATAAARARKNAAEVRRVGLGWTRALARLWEAAALALEGATAEAAAAYGQAADMFREVDMVLYESAARFRHAERLDGPRGEALRREALEALTAQDIVRPERVIAMVAPPPAGK
jgi:serine/threonine protein kinase